MARQSVANDKDTNFDIVPAQRAAGIAEWRSSGIKGIAAVRAVSLKGISEGHTFPLFAGTLEPSLIDTGDDLPIGTEYWQYATDDSLSTQLWNHRKWIRTGYGWERLDSKLHLAGTMSAAIVKSTTAVTLLAAPGAGKAFVVDEVRAFLDYGTTQHAEDAGGSNLQIKVGTAVQATVEGTGFVNGTADEFRVARPDFSTAIEPQANAAVTAVMSAAATTGDSPIYVEVVGRVVETSLSGVVS